MGCLVQINNNPLSLIDYIKIIVSELDGFPIA